MVAATGVGNALSNLIDGQEGADNLMEGGQGDDIYIVDNAQDRIVELAGHGQDVVRTNVSYVLTAGAAVEVLESTRISSLGPSTSRATNLPRPSMAISATTTSTAERVPTRCMAGTAMTNT